MQRASIVSWSVAGCLLAALAYAEDPAAPPSDSEVPPPPPPGLRLRSEFEDETRLRLDVEYPPEGAVDPRLGVRRLRGRARGAGRRGAQRSTS